MAVKKKLGLKIIIIATVAILMGSVVFFCGRYIIYTKIRSTIVAELNNLRTQGIDVTYDHLEVHPWSAKIEFIQLSVKVHQKENIRGIDALIPYVLIKGIDILPFIRHDILSLHEISVEQAAVTYSKGGSVFHSERKKRKIELKEIKVQKINLPGVDLYVKDTVDTDTLAHVLSHVEMKDLSVVKQLDSLIWKNGEIEVSEFALHLYKSDYGVSTHKAVVNIESRTISIDSFRIQPTLTKAEYMKKQGKQSTYFAGAVDKLRITDVNWFTYPNASLEIKKLDLTFDFQMFRDKRYPFLQFEKRDLPSQFIHKLPIQIAIDSVTITDSYLNYEEFPEQSDSSGAVYFEKLDAVVINIHNNPKRDDEMKMFAQANFMGSGLLNAFFTFPSDTLKRCTVSGTLKNLALPDLNNMLGAAAKVKVETGVMTSLKFDFSYNDIESRGNVALVYDDLKILTLKNKDDEQAVSHLKTLLLNTILIKKDVFQNISSDQRKGEIHFIRDQKRSVFNYWWKSIFSGVKSAFYIDKIIADPTQKKKQKGKIKEVLSRIFKKDSDK
jgi:Domain of Unknown Function (DUF748)